MRQSLIDRILQKSKICEISGCWIWQGATSGKHEKGKTGRGYGKISIHGHMAFVHRVMYVCYFGYVPHKIQIDHKCSNRLCVNPYHLEAVSAKENSKRRTERKKHGKQHPDVP